MGYDVMGQGITTGGGTGGTVSNYNPGGFYPGTTVPLSAIPLAAPTGGDPLGQGIAPVANINGGMISGTTPVAYTANPPQPSFNTFSASPSQPTFSGTGATLGGFNALGSNGPAPNVGSFNPYGVPTNQQQLQAQQGVRQAVNYYPSYGGMPSYGGSGGGQGGYFPSQGSYSNPYFGGGYGGYGGMPSYGGYGGYPSMAIGNDPYTYLAGSALQNTYGYYGPTSGGIGPGQIAGLQPSPPGGSNAPFGYPSATYGGLISYFGGLPGRPDPGDPSGLTRSGLSNTTPGIALPQPLPYGQGPQGSYYLTGPGGTQYGPYGQIDIGPNQVNPYSQNKMVDVTNVAAQQSGMGGSFNNAPETPFTIQGVPEAYPGTGAFTGPPYSSIVSAEYGGMPIDPYPVYLAGGRVKRYAAGGRVKGQALRTARRRSPNKWREARHEVAAARQGTAM